MINFRVTPEIFERFPHLKLGVLALSNIENQGKNDELKQLLIETQQNVRQALEGIAVSQHPHVAPWREAYRAFGVKAKQYPSSIENLLKRVQKGENLRSINPLVDLYNVVSLEHHVPVGGEDIDTLEGDIVLRFAGDNEPAIRLLGDSEAKAPKVGEVIYSDDLGAICRRFNWKEADRSKLTPETERAVLVIEALPPTHEDKLQAVLNRLSDLAQRFCGARGESHVLSPVVSGVYLGS